MARQSVQMGLNFSLKNIEIYTIDVFISPLLWVGDSTDTEQ